MKKSRVFVIGVDGGTWDIFDKFMEKGVMPNLKKLVNLYFSTNLESTIPPVTAPAWSSFITGMRPDKHGVYDFARHQRGSYQSLINNANSLKGKSFWKILSEHRKTVGIINVPMTYPPEEVNGFIIPGFLSPGVSKQKILTSPPDLIDELNQQIGNYRIFLEKSPKATIQSAGKNGFLSKCSKIVDRRSAAATFLYQKYQPDFFMVHFLMSDVVQHWFWHCLDESHSRYNDREASEVKSALEEFYYHLDQKIGELIQLTGQDTEVIILSDHGFGPLEKSFFLNRWLYENGFLKLNLKKQQTIKTIRKLIAAIDFLNLRNRLLPSGEKRVALEKSLQHDFLMNWQKTKAFASPASIYGDIFLNIKNREAEGLIKPGTEAEQVIADLKEKLLNFKDPQTNEQVVNQVFLREEIFPNDQEQASPELLIKPTDGYAVFSQLNENKVLRQNIPWEEITGTHRMNGILIVRSEKVKNMNNRSFPARIIDLAPTILYLMGVPIPKNMDGTVLTGIFQPSVLEKMTPEYSEEKTNETKGAETGYSKEEEELIRQRLQDLGYLE